MKLLAQLSCIVALILLVPAFAAPHLSADDEADAAVIKVQDPSYPLDVCAISGQKMKEPVVAVVKGRMAKFCCEKCAGKFEASFDEIVAKVDAAVIAAQGPTYPMTKCVVSGEALEDEDGSEPVDVVHGTRLVRLCCKGCERGFAASPETFLADVDKALIEQQLASYPLTTCLVSGEPLEAKTVNKLYGVQLVRLCCKGCVRAFDKDPKEFVAELEAAKAKEKGEKKAEDEKGKKG